MYKRLIVTLAMIVAAIAIVLLSVCGDGIKQTVDKMEVKSSVEGENYYIVRTTWTDKAGEQTVTEYYVKEAQLGTVKQHQMDLAKKQIREQK